MAADFDAGSIEGTLDLNTAPFYTGLRKAQADAERFESRKDIEPELGLDRTEFNREVAESEVALEGLGRREAKPRVRLLGLGLLLSKVAIAKAALISLALTSIKATGMLALVAAVSSLIAILGPATVALAAFAGAGILAFSGLVAAIIPFAAAMAGAVGKIMQANEEGRKLSGWAGKAQKSLAAVQRTWKQVQEATGPGVFRLLNKSLQLFQVLLSKSTPLIIAVAKGLGFMVDFLSKGVIQTSLFATFIGRLSDFVERFLFGAGEGLMNLLQAWMRLFIAFEPLMNMLGGGILRMLEGFNMWAAALASGKTNMDGFYRSLEQLSDLWSSFWDALKNLGSLFGAISESSFKFLTTLFDTIAGADLTLLADVFNVLLDGMTALMELDGLPGLLRNIALGVGAIALAFAGGPIALILGLVSGIVLLTPLLKDLWAKVEGSGVLDKASDRLSRLWAWTKRVGGAIIAFAQEAWEGWLRPAWQGMHQILTGIVIPALQDFWGWISEKIVPAVRDALAPTFAALAETWKKDVAPALKDGARFFRDELVPALQRVWERSAKFREMLGFLIEKAIQFWGVTAGRVLPVLIKVGGWFISKGIPLTLNLGKNLLQMGERGFAAFNTMWEIAKSVWSWFEKNLLPTFLDIGRVGAQAFSGITDVIGGVIGAVSTLVGWLGKAAGGLRTLIGLQRQSNREGTSNQIPTGGNTGKTTDQILKDSGQLPRSAKGGVTRREVISLLGDNPSREEAIIPLDKYDVPKKGDLERLMAEAQASGGEKVARAIGDLARAILGKKDLDVDELAEKLGGALSKSSRATLSELIQTARSK